MMLRYIIQNQKRQQQKTRMFIKHQITYRLCSKCVCVYVCVWLQFTQDVDYMMPKDRK